MNINFGTWQEEVIYDDHGGYRPCYTEFQNSLTIDGVQFSVKFSDIFSDIDVYHNSNHVVNFYSDKKLTTDKAEKLITAKFRKNVSLQRFVKEKRLEQLNKLKESLYQNLLAEAGD